MRTKPLVKTLTVDNDKEFADHQATDQSLGPSERSAQQSTLPRKRYL
jgi:IS30 family transposase